jgi:hypothetical protein
MTTLDNSQSGQPDNSAAVLDVVHQIIVDYVVMPSAEAIDAAVLWTAVTHAIPAFETAPRFAIGSPMKRCGKTRLLDILTGVSHDPLVVVNATVAAIYRSLDEDHPPTLVIDEADALWGTRRHSEQTRICEPY